MCAVLGDPAAMGACYQQLLALDIRHMVCSHVDVEHCTALAIRALLEVTWGWTLLDPKSLAELRARIQSAFVAS